MCSGEPVVFIFNLGVLTHTGGASYQDRTPVSGCRVLWFFGLAPTLCLMGALRSLG